MEIAWNEATQDPDLQAAWDDPTAAAVAEDTEPETLRAVWGRTAAQLESGELLDGDGLTSVREVPYELNPENRFSELADPFAEGLRLFEEGQIADAALCFEAEIARNPENSQVCSVCVDVLDVCLTGLENDLTRCCVFVLEGGGTDGADLLVESVFVLYQSPCVLRGRTVQYCWVMYGGLGCVDVVGNFAFCSASARGVQNTVQ